ncbi:hypothetical protein Tco_1209352 [Tanacetum coccineum]
MVQQISTSWLPKDIYSLIEYTIMTPKTFGKCEDDSGSSLHKIDPLALVSNASVQQYPTQSSKSPQPPDEPSPADNFQLDSGSSSTENLIETTVQGRRVVVQMSVEDSMRIIKAKSKLLDSDYFKDKMLLMQAQENGAVLDEEQSLFLAGEQVTNFDDDVDDSPENDLALNVDHIFEADQLPPRFSKENLLATFDPTKKSDQKQIFRSIVENDRKKAKTQFPDNTFSIDSIMRAHTSEKTSTMLNEIESLKAQLRSKVSCVTSDSVKPKVLAPGMYAIDVKPIPHPLKNNRSAFKIYQAILKRV